LGLIFLGEKKWKTPGLQKEFFICLLGFPPRNETYEMTIIMYAASDLKVLCKDVFRGVGKIKILYFNVL
jgi:hypothetical protein